MIYIHICTKFINMANKWAWLVFKKLLSPEGNLMAMELHFICHTKINWHHSWELLQEFPGEFFYSLIPEPTCKVTRISTMTKTVPWTKPQSGSSKPSSLWAWDWAGIAQRLQESCQVSLDRIPHPWYLITSISNHTPHSHPWYLITFPQFPFWVSIIQACLHQESFESL